MRLWVIKYGASFFQISILYLPVLIYFFLVFFYIPSRTRMRKGGAGACVRALILPSYSLLFTSVCVPKSQAVFLPFSSF